ncbi:J domain-containing protein [Leifsonia sp. YIM 134122]|uniref:J domain-containing protein n=1 Tax=Leifsonia stereocauli TaxID=3134136 RepID=A0ABU9W5L8_9MICO
MASTQYHGAMTPERAAAILGVSPTATPTEIRAAYNARARLAHPDRFAGGTPKQQTDAAAHFIRLTEAYEVLRLYGYGGGGPGPAASGTSSATRPPHVDDNPAPRTSGTSHRAPASGDYAAPGAGDDGIWMTRPDHAMREATRRQRAVVRGVVIVVAALVALLFSSNAVGLSPGSFRIPPHSDWYLPVMLVAELVCLLAVASCAGYAATGVPWLGSVGVALAGAVVLAFIASAIISAPFTFSTLVFTSFAAFVTASPFLALVLIGRSRQEARAHPARTTGGTGHPASGS